MTWRKVKQAQRVRGLRPGHRLNRFVRAELTEKATFEQSREEERDLLTGMSGTY